MPVEGDGGVRLEVLAVDGGEDADVVVGAGGGGDDAVLGVDELVELADDKGDTLDPLDLRSEATS